MLKIFNITPMDIMFNY